MRMFGILYVLFTYAFPQGSKGIESYGVWLLMGIVLWNFFSEATMIGTRSVVDNGQLIRKVAIPRHLLVIASSVSALINLGLGMIVVILFAFLSGLFPTFSWLLLIPGYCLYMGNLIAGRTLCEWHYFCGYFYAVSHTEDCIFKSNYADYPRRQTRFNA